MMRSALRVAGSSRRGSASARRWCQGLSQAWHIRRERGQRLPVLCIHGGAYPHTCSLPSPPLPPRRNVQAGVTSRAVLSVLVLPLDTIRVRDQKAPPPPFPSSSPGFVPAELSEEARPTVQRAATSGDTDRRVGAGGGEKWSLLEVGEAVSDLYRGWLPAVAFAGPSTAVFFGVNEYLLSVSPTSDFSFGGWGGVGMGDGGWRAVAAMAASISSWLIRTPFEVVKVALMGKQYASSRAAVRGIGARGRLCVRVRVRVCGRASTFVRVGIRA